MNNLLQEAKDMFDKELDHLAEKQNGGGEEGIFVEITYHAPNVSRKSEFSVYKKEENGE